MKNTFTRSAYIPSGAKKIDTKDDRFEAYVGERAGKVIGIAFVGKSQRPSYHYSFKTVEDAFKSTLGYVMKVQLNLDIREEAKKQRRIERSAPHTLKVGDIMYSTWGYDQTNVDFYQVVKLVGTRMVEFTEIHSTKTYEGHMHGSCLPLRDSYGLDAEFRRAVVDGRNNSFKVRSFANAYPWDGRSIGFSEWA